MIERPQNHWKLGLFLSTSALLMVAAIVWFGTRGLGRETLNAVSFFDESVEGLSVGSPLSFRGVPMGRVERITFAPNGRDVEVHLGIYGDVIERLGLSRGVLFPSPGESGDVPSVRIQINRSGLTGITFLEADFFDPKLYPERRLDFSVPRNTIPSQPSTLAGLGQSLTETMAQLPELTAGLSGLIARLDARLEQLDTEGLLRQTAQTLLRAEQAFELLGGPKASEALTGIAQASGSIDGLGADVQATLGDLRDTLKSFNRLAQLLERDPAALLHGRRQ